MKILVQFPTLGRPQQFLETFTHMVNSLSGEHDIFVHVVGDIDDKLMRESEALRAAKLITVNRKRIDVGWSFLSNTTKISAINHGIEDIKSAFDFDMVICMSDDMVCQVDGWDDVLAKAMQENYPDTMGALDFHDGNKDSELITFSILGRKLYDHFGYIYHPDYKSLYCDNEFTDVVKSMDCVTYLDQVIFKHAHYALEGNENSGNGDATAAKTLKYAYRDGQVYQQRKTLGFPKEKITND